MSRRRWAVHVQPAAGPRDPQQVDRVVRLAKEGGGRPTGAGSRDPAGYVLVGTVEEPERVELLIEGSEDAARRLAEQIRAAEPCAVFYESV